MSFAKIKNTFAVLAGLLLAGSVYVHFLAGDAGDKDWLLTAAKMVLSGKKLYVDIFESNPPLIIWLYTIPSFIAAHLGMQDYYALVFLGFCAVALSTFISTKIIGIHPEFVRDIDKRQFAALLVFVFIFCTSPVYFFDREYILLVLTFPYILRWMPAAYQAQLPLRLRIIIGSMAALGFCIKPHCLIVFAGIQLITVLRERRFHILISIENLIIYLAGLLYLIAVWSFTPEYFTAVLPIAIETYSGYGEKQNGLLFLAAALFSLGVTFVDFRPRYTTPYRKEIYYFLQVSLAFAFYAFANNGWGYTYNPLISTLLIITGWVFWDFRYLQKEYAAQGLPIKQFIFGARACGINFAINAAPVLASFFMLATSNCDSTSECRLDDALLKVVQQQHAHSFGTLALKFHPWAPLIRASGATLETRFNHLWMMPRIVAGDPDFQRKHEWIVEYVGNAFAEDLNHREPELVFVDNSPVFVKNKHADLLATFSAFPNFARAWQHYHYLQSVDQCTKVAAATSSDTSRALPVRMACKYDIYVRTP